MEHGIPLEQRDFSQFAQAFRLAAFPRNQKDIGSAAACTGMDLYDFTGRLLDAFSMFAPKTENDEWNTIGTYIKLDDATNLFYCRTSDKDEEGREYKGYWINSFDGRHGGHDEYWGLFFQPESKQVRLYNNGNAYDLDNIDFSNRDVAQADLLSGLIYDGFWPLSGYVRRMRNFGLQAEHKKNVDPAAPIILGL